jgi:O-antigen ligase
MNNVADYEVYGSIILGLIFGSIIFLVNIVNHPLKPSLIVMAMLAFIGLVIILLLDKRREILLALLAFSVSLAAFDKWFLPQPVRGGTYGIQVSLPDLILLVLYGIWIANHLFSLKDDAEKKELIFYGIIPALLFVFLCSLSALNANYLNLVGVELLQMIKMIFWYYFIVNNLKNEKDIKLVLGGLVASVLFQSAFAIAEKASGGNFGLSVLGEAEKIITSYVSNRDLTRVSGLTPHPNALGNFIALTMPFMLAVLLTGKNNWLRYAAFISIPLGSLALIFTFSRGALLGWVTGFAFYIFLVAKSKSKTINTKIIYLLGIVVIVIFLFLSPKLYQRFTTSKATGFTARYKLDKVAIDMTKAHPVIGIGLNNFSKDVTKYDKTGISLIFPEPVHNIFLLYLSETGILGFAGFILVIAVVVKAGYTVYRRAGNDFLCLTAGAGLASIVVFAVTGSVSWALRTSPVTQVFWFILGIIVVVYHINNRSLSSLPS